LGCEGSAVQICPSRPFKCAYQKVFRDDAVGDADPQSTPTAFALANVECSLRGCEAKPNLRQFKSARPTHLNQKTSIFDHSHCCKIVGDFVGPHAIIVHFADVSGIPGPQKARDRGHPEPLYPGLDKIPQRPGPPANLLSGSAYSGFAYGLYDDNSNYSGGFTSISASYGPISVTGSRSSNGVGEPIGVAPPGTPGAVTTITMGGGEGLNSQGTAFGSVTNYSNPIQIGQFTGFGYIDFLAYGARQLCKALGY
jgi:hypothetical protein